MGWNDVGKKSGGQDDTLKLAPNTTTMVHVLLKGNEEPISYWTHYIPNISGSGQIKGLVIICPGKDVCPACKVGSYRTKRVHALNVWDFTTKTIKILEQGNQIMEQLKILKDMYGGTLDSVDISVRRVGQGQNTTYVVAPIPCKTALDYSGVFNARFDLSAMKQATPVAEVQRIIDDMTGINANAGAGGQAQSQQTATPKPNVIQPAPPVQQPQPAAVVITPSVSTAVQPPPMAQPAEPPSVPLAQQAAPLAQQAPPANVVDDAAVKLPFGKHKGKTIAEVAETDFTYIEWCANNMQDITIKTACTSYLSKLEAGEVDTAESKTAKSALMNSIQRMISTDERYTADYQLIVKKMKDATKSPQAPNGKMMLDSYTFDELERLFVSLK